jgi:RNA polymerase sigma-70 factor (ECF subfamily)
LTRHLLEAACHPRAHACASYPRKEGSDATDDPTISEFIERDYARVVAAVALLTGSHPAAEDVVQEALARAWERMDRGEYIETLAGWVTVAASNLARSGLRRLSAERRATVRLDARQGGTPSPDAEEVVDVARALHCLPRRQREAIVLHYWLDLTTAQVATTLRISEGTVKTALRRGRERLAVELGDRADEGEGVLDG